MILVAILFVPVCAGVLACLSQSLDERLPGRISFTGLFVDFLLVVYLWLAHVAATPSAPWFAEVEAPWFASLGVNFHLALDGVGLILIALTAFLGCLSVLASWKGVGERNGFYFLCLTWTIAGILGVFLAVDLFLFYFAWEFMLVPMFFLIALWGHEDRFRAGVKFFVFTQAGGLLMLGAILGLYFVHGRVTGVYTFDLSHLTAFPMSARTGQFLLWGFLAAFLIKLPAFPVHTWLPDAHTQAPTAGSMILAGLLLKTGAYGIIRFAVPLFPGPMHAVSLPLEVLGVIGILYGALLAFGQIDLKRLVAYTSVSHMGFVLLGLSVGNELALQGTILQIVSHGLSTGALFFLAGAIQERLQTRDLSLMGGLWSLAPRLGGSFLFFAVASLGLPGMGNFAGEFLVVLGAYKVSPVVAAIAALGFIASTAYSLRMMHRVFFGTNDHGWRMADLSAREMAVVVVMMLPLLWVGFYPQSFVKVTQGIWLRQGAGKVIERRASQPELSGVQMRISRNLSSPQESGETWKQK